MSRTSTFTLDHQWDPYDILDVERDRRCVGWAHSKGRKCYNVVNWADMDTFCELLTEMSSRPMDATHLQHHLRRLASVGLCKQIHRRAQKADMVDKWTTKINAAVRRAELQVDTPYIRSNTRSSTASFASTGTFRTPPTRSTRSSNSTVSASPSQTVQLDIDSTLRCLEAIHEQQRILMLRLACLQTLDAPRLDPIQRPARVSTASVSSLHLSDTSTVASSHTVRSHTTATSRRSTSTRSTSSQPDLSSSSSGSSSPPDQRNSPHTLQDTPYPTRPAARPQHRTSPPSHPSQESHFAAVDVSIQSNTSHRTLIQEGQDVRVNEAIAAQTSRNVTNSSSPALSSPVSITITATSPSHTTPRSTQATEFPPSPSFPPRCPSTHVRRLPITDECPICYEGGPMSTLPARDLVWCTSSCGRTVHKSCFDAWATEKEDTELGVTCPVCRANWEQSCECGGRSQCGVVHGERQEVGGECPICREGMGGGHESVEWCKDGCGQKVHEECMRTWAGHCLACEMVVSCVMCRAEWT